MVIAQENVEGQLNGRLQNDRTISANTGSTGNDDPICRRIRSVEQATRLRRALTLPVILPPRAAVVIN